VLFGVNNFYIRDLTRYYYPAKHVLREIVLGGEFPLWNRLFSAGQPIAANPEHEVFYPFTWLILLPDYDLGFRLHILVHIYIGLVGMYALLRSMELRPYAAFLGAISWGVGGLYVSYINLLPILFCVAWLPFTCLFVRRFLLRPNRRDFALGALFLGLQFLVGEPTTVAQTGFLLGMYALYRAWYARPRVSQAVTRLLWIALISAAAFLTGAAQMLPALDHVADSARSRPFGFDLVSAWSMPWAKFAELIYPNILGHLSIDRVTWYWAGGLYPGMGSPFLFNVYCGLLVTALAIGGAFARPRGGRLLIVILLVSTLLALGSHTPLLKWLYEAGIAKAVRYPEKFLLMAIFTLVVFSAAMLDRLLAGDNEIRDGALGFAAAVFVVALFVSITTFTPLFGKAMTKIWSLTPGPNANRIIAISSRDWLWAAGRAGCAVVLLATVRMRRRDLWCAAATLFVVADLAPISADVNPRMSHRFFESSPGSAMLPPNRADYRVFHEVDWYGQEETARKYFSTGAGVYWVVRNGLFPMVPAGAGVQTVLERDYDKTQLLPTIDLTDSVWDVKRNGRSDWYVPFMAMSNAWFRAEYRDFEKERKRINGDFTKSMPVRFTPAPHYPRYYFADQIVTIRARADFVRKLREGSYSERVAFITRPAFVPADGAVLRATESANHATLDVESRGQGFLVMSVTPHKYWHITVDGRPVPAIVTNIGYQGIVVSAGKHRVEMRYDNPLVRTGGATSILTCLLLSLMAAWPRRREEVPAPATTLASLPPETESETESAP
jgi:hypothetical protein